MYIPSREARPEFREDGADVQVPPLRLGWGCGRPKSGPLADAKIGGYHQVQRRMIDPISGQLLDIEEGHSIDYGIAVAAAGGEETVDMPPSAVGLDPDARMPAPGSGPGPALPPAIAPAASDRSRLGPH